MTDQERHESCERIMRIMAAMCEALTKVQHFSHVDGPDDARREATHDALGKWLLTAMKVYPSGQMAANDIRRLGEAFGMQVEILDLGKMPAPGGPLH